MGLNNETIAYRLYDRTRQKIVISRDVAFDETKMGLHHLNTSEPTENTIFPLRSDGTDTDNQLVESSVPWTPELTDFDEIATEASGCENRSSEIGADTRLDDLPDHEQSRDQLGPTPANSSSSPGRRIGWSTCQAISNPSPNSFGTHKRLLVIIFGIT